MVQVHVVMTFVISMKIDLYSSYLFASILFTFLQRILRLVSYCFLLILKSRKKVSLTLKRGERLLMPTIIMNLTFQ